MRAISPLDRGAMSVPDEPVRPIRSSPQQRRAIIAVQSQNIRIRLKTLDYRVLDAVTIAALNEIAWWYWDSGKILQNECAITGADLRGLLAI